ncbi:metallophosphoesterase family protein [Echinicola arenosa]|nr:metallophosphoesterase [Echinicola arenosa]
MNKNYLLTIILGAAMQLVSTNMTLLAQTTRTEIAFLSDIHLQDVHADLNSAEFKGVLNPKTGKFATIRTMQSQLNSTRLFNENYFAFISALEDLKEREIQLVVLPGDFTDDGQPMNVIALKKILDQYAEDAGMRFFLTTGNHDPVKPFGGIAGKRDFLGKEGAEQAIAGAEGLFDRQTAITEQINYWGYSDITGALRDFGFFPNEKDLFWSHPFQELEVDNYDFQKAKESSDFKNRVYPIGDSSQTLPDASYVVEPVEGIWLLALDGNVYTPSKNEWKGSSVGFNQAAIHKRHQLDWIEKVVHEADKRGKTLISFSHYPLMEFHDGASDDMKSLFGEQKFQLARVPSLETTKLYAKAGIRLHFAGHMHINDTGIYHDSTESHVLFNIQVPSLAAFPPAYKTLKTLNTSSFEIETIQLKEVENMTEFFDLYRMEYDWLSQNQDPRIWDSTILASQDYLDYTRNHLIGLTRSRFIPSDWPENLAVLLQNLTDSDFKAWSEMDKNEGEAFLYEKVENFKAEMIDQVPAQSIIDDFYLLKNGDELGKELIASERLSYYEELIPMVISKDAIQGQSINAQLIQFFVIFDKLLHSLPSDHFSIDLKSNGIQKIND